MGQVGETLWTLGGYGGWQDIRVWRGGGMGQVGETL